MTWLAVLASAAGCYAVKLAGALAPRQLLDRVRPVTMSLPIALLTSLIVVQTVGNGRHLTIDARLVGLAVAALAVWHRLPFLVVVIAAAMATAITRTLS
jgi:uncharacterized membrane protein